MIGAIIKGIFGGGGKSAIQQGASAFTKVRGAFKVGATAQFEQESKQLGGAQGLAGKEYENAGDGFLDQLMNFISRLPRPALALGTIGLFIYAFYDPDGFAVRMEALNNIPEQLWWLMGAVVTFYFGARESYKMRANKTNIKASEEATARHNAEAERHKAGAGEATKSGGNEALAKINKAL